MNLYLMTPHIIKESSEGTTYCPVQDELFTRHTWGIPSSIRKNASPIRTAGHGQSPRMNG